MTEAGLDTRPMSLATSPTRQHLEYAVRLSDSPYKRAFATLEPGDEVAVFGPIGNFVLDETGPAILIAGGIGITPFKGMAEYAADRALPVPIRLVYSSRSQDEIVYRDELAALEAQNPRFHVLHTVTGLATHWRGATGRIDLGLLREAAGDLADPVYYVSGTPSMVVGTLRLLRGEGAPADDIEVEAFRGYGLGTTWRAPPSAAETAGAFPRSSLLAGRVRPVPERASASTMGRWTTRISSGRG